MMIDFKGLNRGFCFVQYTNSSDAEKAITDLDNYEIVPGRRIGVVKSVDNSRLFLRGIPLDKTEQDILTEIETITDGVTKVQLGPNSGTAEMKKNRGFAYVEYQSHKAACLARRKLVSSSIRMWGRNVHVDWALDGLEVKTLHVQNISPKSSHEDLKRIFNEVSQNGVEYVKIIRKYAFIQFVTRELAMNARLALEGQEVDGAKVRINWARPVNAHNGKNNFSRKRSPSPPRSKFRNNRNQIPREKLNHPVVTNSIATSDQRAYGYPDNFDPRSNDPQRELHFMCVSQGWAEPIYIPIAIRQGQSLYYGCKVVVPHPMGQREYQTQNYYFNAVDAKTAAAEGLLRVLQGLVRPVLVALPNHYGHNVGRGPREAYNW
ncbi:unnamed protein product [Allacma fusca]|uniref:RRM domain-containing protein n=1 Tax=Allacma fusca TaxID=39272 RepID=A0A8J2JAV4_9HEXA|nr:unnamed protein product [Allacma fusca]